MPHVPRLAVEPYGRDKMRTVDHVDVSISDAPGITHLVTIPAGYVFDGASVPRIAWSVIGHPFDPTFALAACVHDWYCDAAVRLKDYQLRVIGDSVFFALLARAGVAEWRRVAMYAAVRFWSFANRKRIVSR